MRGLLCVLLVACGGSKTTSTTIINQPEQSGSSQPMIAAPTRPVCTDDHAKCAVATFGFFTDQVCACTDKACAEKVTAEVSAWGTKMSQQDLEQTPDTAKAINDLGQKYAACVTKLYTGSSTPPPDPCGGGADPCGG